MPGDQELKQSNLLIADARIFGVAAFLAGMELEFNAEILGLGFRSSLCLDNDLIAFAFGQRGFGDKEAALLLELDLRLAARCLSRGCDDFAADGLGFQRDVIERDTDATVFFDEELGLRCSEIHEQTFPGSGFDLGVGKSGSGGEGNDDEEFEKCFHGVFVVGLVFRSIQS